MAYLLASVLAAVHIGTFYKGIIGIISTQSVTHVTSRTTGGFSQELGELKAKIYPLIHANFFTRRVSHYLDRLITGTSRPSEVCWTASDHTLTSASDSGSAS
jgi:hypothetical protein